MAFARRKSSRKMKSSYGWSMKKKPSASFDELSSQRPENLAASSDGSYWQSVLRSTYVFVPPILSGITSLGFRPAIMRFSDDLFFYILKLPN